MQDYSRWAGGRNRRGRLLAAALAGIALVGCASSEEKQANPRSAVVTATEAEPPAGPTFEAIPQAVPPARPLPLGPAGPTAARPLVSAVPLAPSPITPAYVPPPRTARPAPVYVPPTPAYVPPYIPPTPSPQAAYAPAEPYIPSAPTASYSPSSSSGTARSVPASSEISIQDEAPLIYVVKPGDTLWGIAKRFLKDAYQWPEVWYANDTKVTNPHLIFPGDVLKLVYKNKRPVVVREETPLPPPEPLNVARLSPQIRNLELPAAIPTIPLEAIRDFLRGPRLVTADQLAASPYLLAFSEEHIVGGSGNGIYVQNLKTRGNQTYFDVVRKGEVYRDPDDNEVIGYEAMPIGEAEVTKFGEPSKAVLSRTFREALLGDHLLPSEADAFRANFYPRPPPREIRGRIISVYDGVSQIGQYQIVAMNRGAQHGLEQGHVLDILQAGVLAPDPYSKRRVRLPDEHAGQLLVFKVTPRVSFGLVMEVTRPVHRLDKVEKPVPGRK